MLHSKKIDQMCTQWRGALEVATPLIMRLVVGSVFAFAGWGKLHNLAGVTEFFQSLGIPFANIQAPFVAVVELLGGVALIIGACTRCVALPLMVIMVVALATAKQEAFVSLSELFETDDFLYFIILMALATYGAGKASVDHFWCRKP